MSLQNRIKRKKEQSGLEVSYVQSLRKIAILSILFILGSSVLLVGTFHYYDTLSDENTQFSEGITSISQQSMFKLFFDNSGQILDTEVSYLASLSNGVVGLGPNGLTIWLHGGLIPIRISFEGNSLIEPKGQMKSNFQIAYIGNQNGQTKQTNTYSSILYENLWPDVDLSFQISRNCLEGNLLFGSQASRENIGLRIWDGHISDTSGSNFSIISDNREPLELNLNQGFSDDLYFSKIDDSSMSLIVSDNWNSGETTLDFSIVTAFLDETYLEDASSIAMDLEGNVYVAGTITFISETMLGVTTVSSDCFVFKVSSDGSDILYATIIGGTEDDYAESLTVDTMGRVYLVGGTKSSDFPVVNPYSENIGGSLDAFVLRLNDDGQTIDYATFLGGEDIDRAFGITVDASGQAIITGQTASRGFPTMNAIQSFHGGGYLDSFLTKLSAQGDSVIFSTYFGGSRSDFGRAVTVDSDGNIHVTGTTWSDDFRVYRASDYVYNGHQDCFVLKLSSSGSDLQYSTFIGGSWIDQGESISVDSDGIVHIAGTTFSNDFPVVDSYDSTYNGGGDCFIIRLDENSSTVSYSSFLGGESRDVASQLYIDSMSFVYIIGTTYSVDFPTTNTHSSSNSVPPDCFVSKLTDTGQDLLFSTYIAGTGFDYGKSIFVSDEGYIYVAGSSNSTDLQESYTYNASISEIYDSVFVYKLHDLGDSDGDGLEDELEQRLGTNRYLVDSDFDGLSDSREINELMTNPLSNDSDSDNIVDGLEVMSYGTNPLSNDTDEDNLTDLDEITIHFTNPLSNDSDNDDLTDDIEIQNYSTNPLMVDSDSDQLNDSMEVLVYLTNPLSNDSDGDTMPDKWEIDFELDPLVNDAGNDKDLDGLTNLEEYLNLTYPNVQDSDNDNITDLDELATYFTNPINVDSDSDDLTDWQEIFVHLSNPNSDDTDNDLMLDGWEIQFSLNITLDDAAGDLDVDTLSNLDEFLNGTYPDKQDSDNDNITDYEEIVTYFTNPLVVDSDNDNLTDWQEITVHSTNPLSIDSDDDNAFDWYEIVLLLTDPLLNDTDSDSMRDGWEALYGLNPLLNDSYDDLDLDGLHNIHEYTNNTRPDKSDSDMDGLSDLEEIVTYLTDPNSNDTDLDTVSDFVEIETYGSNPLSNHSDSDIMPDEWEARHGLNLVIDDSAGDLDYDNITNLNEYLNGTYPDSNDTDDDSLYDFDEIAFYLTDPTNNDTDHDNLSDYLEIAVYFTNPFSVDSDNDTMIDGWEVEFSLNPMINDTLSDRDGDGLVNILELFYGTKPNVRDTDLDLVSDWLEITLHLTDPLQNDTELDGMPDGWESKYCLNPLVDDGKLDFDYDGLSNLEEFVNNAIPIKRDSDADTLSDLSEVTIYFTNPLKVDSDSDDLTDVEELFDYLTNPNRNDTDSDLMPDGWEILYNTNPLQDDSGLDQDSDGLTNLLEYQYFGDPNSNDTDSDGLSDFDEAMIHGTSLELSDTDSDLLSDYDELITYLTLPTEMDTDLDNVTDGIEVLNLGTNPLSTDSDGDTMLDGWEDRFNLNPLVDDRNLDYDEDGLSNIAEYGYGSRPDRVDSDKDTLDDFTEIMELGTNPASADSDNDGMPDNWELFYSYDPLVNDSYIDSDGDLLSNLDEYKSNSDPNLVDTDSDGFSDYDEVKVYHTNANNTDSDNDDISDYDEILVYGTNPLQSDSDQDGMGDLWEINANLDPLIPDASEDYDSDGLSNLEEHRFSTDPYNMDSDNDMLSDFQEVHIYLTNPNNADSDSDNLGDYEEVMVYDSNPLAPDTDFDGLQDSEEAGYGTNPRLSDSDADSIGDWWEIMNGYDALNPDVSPFELIHYNAPLILLVVLAGVLIGSVVHYRVQFKSKLESLFKRSTLIQSM
ncbi:MAG: SBBP repeat-containing protein [Candidatus Thorarchaeota archaeon]|jgi:hypothetical protein